MAFEMHQKVLFRHCDPAGIVFFPRYFEMVNDCVEDFFDKALDWPFEALMGNAGVPTVDIQATYDSPSRHGDELMLELIVEKVGRTSLGYRMIARAGAEQRFIAKATLVYINADGRPAPWPADIREKLLNMKEKDIDP